MPVETTPQTGQTTFDVFEIDTKDNMVSLALSNGRGRGRGSSFARLIAGCLITNQKQREVPNPAIMAFARHLSSACDILDGVSTLAEHPELNLEVYDGSEESDADIQP